MVTEKDAAKVPLLLIYSLHKLSNNKRDTLDSFNLFLCAYQLSLKTPAECEYAFRGLTHIYVLTVAHP